MANSYRPPRRSPPRSQWSEDMYKDQDHPSSDSVRMREWDRSDPYTERRDYRSRSPYAGESEGGTARGRDRQYDRDTQVAYGPDDHVQADALSYRQDGRAPPAKRPYRGRERYEEEDYYAEPPVVDMSYRGENDTSIDGKPMRLLLIRNLKESVTEELFAKGLEKLYLDASSTSDGPRVGAPEGSLRRVLIIRDRQTDKNMHFGFAEYHHVSDANAALAKAEELAEKCTISSKIIQVSFPHLTVFPRADFGGQERSGKYLIEMASTGQMHKYHDERYYPSEMIVNEQAPYRESSPAKEGNDPPESAGATGNGTLDGKQGKKRKAPGTAAPAFLQHWQNKAAELRSAEEKAQMGREKDKVEKASRAPASGVNTISAPTSAVESHEQTFAVDTSKLKCCYLCACQFQTSEGLQRHLKESTKHTENLQNEEMAKKGHARLKQANVTPESTIKLLITPSRPAIAASDVSDSAYRDRAAERRKEEHHTTKVSNSDSNSMLSFSLKPNKSNASGKRSPQISDSEGPPTAPSYGKGMGMLQKAGWSAGQSLGAGTGVTAPIEQNLYASGVGLGHESGKLGDAVEEAQRMTKGERGGFLEKTREVARQRFERLG